jgi:hypothetical protein
MISKDEVLQRITNNIISKTEENSITPEILGGCDCRRS